MQSETLTHCYRGLIFDEGNPLAEKNTRLAVILTAIAMVAEIASGWAYNSMALLADGWHMSSHALALGLSVFAYAMARKYAQHPQFAFGTWKIEILGGYTSAIFLLAIAGLMLYHSVERLFLPSPIHYDQAILVAFLGLLVNLVCAWLLKDGHHHHHHHGGHDHHAHHDHGYHHHDHDHDHGHGHHDDHHHDLNLRAAYLHVLADALTSLLAIFALFGGKLWGADWLDPLMGIVGSVLVAIWAFGLIRDTGRVLLDAEMDKPIVDKVRAVLAKESPESRLNDFHLWRVGKQHYACVVSIALANDTSVEKIKDCLNHVDEIVHLTVEVNSTSAVAHSHH